MKATMRQLRELQRSIDIMLEDMGISHSDGAFACVELAVIYLLMCRKPELTKLETRDHLMEFIKCLFDTTWDNPRTQAAFTIYQQAARTRTRIVT